MPVWPHEALVERLASLEGADVYDARGKHLGVLIEVVGDKEELAIRHEGAFVWRRRLVPIANTVDVLPGHGARGAVVLDLDGEMLRRATQTAVAVRDPTAERPLSARLAAYVDDAPTETVHLLFVPTVQGYRLVEVEGLAPDPLQEVRAPGYESTFRVVKVAPSPLPGDDRPCAYLERR